MASIEDIPEILANFPRKQAIFIENYVKNQNASQAAELAGYSKASCRTMGSKFLKDPKIRKAIDEVRECLSVANAYGLEESIKELDEKIAKAERMNQMNAAMKGLEMKNKILGLLSDKLHIESDKPLFSLQIAGIAAPEYAREVGPKELNGKKGKDS